ncbi:NADP-dependent oxidoreductase [Nocardioides sp.]|uniref:NADP-dependent oxidoreductase n=1 Tax=Nocardioides sp. TaxID=35761 RepID=UPI003D0FA33F
MSKEVRLVRRPVGQPSSDDFEVVDRPAPTSAPPGHLLVRNTWMSVDPYMRGRMNDVRSYVDPFALGAALDGAAVGQVIGSSDPRFPVGSDVIHGLGWREVAVVEASTARRIDTRAAPAECYLGELGMPGLTAYVGLTRIAPVKQGDVVFISAAAGAVGLVAKTVARARGASRVIGSSGSSEKCHRLVNEFGFDVAINYRDGDLGHQLAHAAPRGIDVYFDNVGGGHLEAALDNLADHGSVALCGAISQYNEEQRPAGPTNLILAITRRLALRGFLVGDHLDLLPEFGEAALAWRRDGQLASAHSTHIGIESAVEAFTGLLTGENTGKMLVRL